jgi:hypothetical protein
MVDRRQERALRQRLLLDDTIIEVDTTSAKFRVIGSTGSIYQVQIDKKCSCTCMDFLNRRVACKHIYFVLARVLRQSEDIWRQGGNFDDIIVENLLQTAQNVQINRYKESAIEDGKVESVIPKVESTIQNDTNRRNVSEQKECCICLYDFVEGEQLIFCYNTCGYNFHQLCFARMKKDQCPMCRSELKIQRKRALKRKISVYAE